MASMTTEELLGMFEEMTVLELKEFLDAFEEHFDVTAAAPMAMAVAAGDGAGAEAPAEEQTEFDVVLTGSGDKKIQVIKEVRAMTSLGLKEAKAVVDGLPAPSSRRSPRRRPAPPRRRSKRLEAPSRSASGPGSDRKRLTAAPVTH